jgi:hypothetical protein
MILFIQYPNMERKFWKISDFEDLNPVFEMFPRTYDIATSCDTLSEALDSISEYLSGHNMSSWVENQDISKSLRSKALSVGLSLATALTPTVLEHQRPSANPSKPPQFASVRDTSKDFGTHPMDKFLWNVAQIESSGGKNTKHPKIKYGISKGDHAMGKWGLLKPTVNELINRQRIKGTLTPEMSKLESMSRDAMDKHFKENPQAELDIARLLATHVHDRQKGNEHRAAYAWLHGHNLFPQDIPREKLIHSDYVSKYKQLGQMNPFQPKTKPVAMQKTQQSIDSSDFRERVKAWHKRRENELTDEPMRSSNFQPDPGRLRDSELDEIKPDSMKSPQQRLQANIKQANKKSP